MEPSTVSLVEASMAESYMEMVARLREVHIARLRATQSSNTEEVEHEGRKQGDSATTNRSADQDR